VRRKEGWAVRRKTIAIANAVAVAAYGQSPACAEWHATHGQS
jgi:hypothetical protein